jgi:ferredoxin-NADP reductase
VFAEAKTIGLVTHYIDTSATPINPDVIAQSVADYKQRLFYVSGPYGFVKAARESLVDLGVSQTKIKSDYFPGYGS